MPETSIDDALKAMPNAQKASLLLIALGQKWATEIMRLLKADEVKKISYWITRMDHVPQELTERVIKEFYERLVRKTSLASSGGRDYLLEILSGMMGESRAKEVVDDMAQQEDNDVFAVLRRGEPKQLAAYLKQEQPQTVALMLSHVDPKRAADIIAALPEAMQIEIVMRLAKLEETDPDVVAAMEKTLTQSLGAMTTGKRMQKVGGPKMVAELMNYIPREAEKTLMEKLGEKDFDLANAIKDLMFVFADIVLLDDKSIQAVLKDVDQADLLMAMKGASASVREKVFKNISKRQADTINDELAFMGPVKASVVNEAQTKIINIIRKLDQEGKILIQGKGGSDDVIA